MIQIHLVIWVGSCCCHSMLYSCALYSLEWVRKKQTRIVDVLFRVESCQSLWGPVPSTLVLILMENPHTTTTPKIEHPSKYGCDVAHRNRQRNWRESQGVYPPRFFFHEANKRREVQALCTMVLTRSLHCAKKVSVKPGSFLWIPMVEKTVVWLNRNYLCKVRTRVIESDVMQQYS